MGAGPFIPCAYRVRLFLRRFRCAVGTYTDTRRHPQDLTPWTWRQCWDFACYIWYPPEDERWMRWDGAKHLPYVWPEGGG